jgi:hypothetical protein
VLGGTSGAVSADYKIPLFRDKLIRELKAGNREICKAKCIFTVGAEKMQMGIIRVGTGTIRRTKCVFGTVAGIINPMD